MLFDISEGCRLVDPKSLKEIELYLSFKSKNHTNIINSIFSRQNKFIESEKPSKVNQLTWVRLAKMLGRKSASPHKDICYIEDIVEKSVGDGKLFLKLCGLLFMITIAERSEEHWLCSKVESDERDPDTGEFISWRGYWINKDFQVPNQYKKYDISDLLSKFNKRSN